jgi:hypothetical protein
MQEPGAPCLNSLFVERSDGCSLRPEEGISWTAFRIKRDLLLLPSAGARADLIRVSGVSGEQRAKTVYNATMRAKFR